MRVAPTNQAQFINSYRCDLLDQLGFRKNGYHSFEQVVLEAKTNNYMEGHNGRVYVIPRMPQYVLKELKKDPPRMSLELELVADPLPERNISQVVARKGRYQILRRQPGITGGVVPFQDYVHPGPKGDAAYRTYINLVANMPQKAFDHLAETMVALTFIGYIFDWSHGRNLMFDVGKGEINVVDTRPSTCKLTTGQMVPPLIDTIYAYKTPTKFPELCEMIQTIITKSIEAALKKGLPLQPLYGEATKFEEHARMEYTLELAGKKGEWPEMRKEILKSTPCITM